MNLQRFAKLLVFLVGPLMVIGAVVCAAVDGYLPNDPVGPTGAMLMVARFGELFGSIGALWAFLGGAMALSFNGWACPGCTKRDTEITELRNALTETTTP